MFLGAHVMFLRSWSLGLVLQERRFMNQLPNFVAFCYNLLAARAKIHESCLSPHGSKVNNRKGLGQAARVKGLGACCLNLGPHGLSFPSN